MVVRLETVSTIRRYWVVVFVIAAVELVVVHANQICVAVVINLIAVTLIDTVSSTRVARDHL